MIWEGNLRKMRSSVLPDGQVKYALSGADVIEPLPETAINGWIGKRVQIHFEGLIHCVVSGKRIKKTYGEGMSYDAFLKSPLACPSIIRPELSRIHEGIALRDEAWERANHLQPHVVYISQTSHLKVGVTRATNVPSRWVDQGACGAIVVANAPYRQLAGEMEVALKETFSDRTHWRNMLTSATLDKEAMVEAKEEALDDADCLVICTEWKLFRAPDFADIKRRLTSPVIIDGRNLYNPEDMEAAGIEYFGIGRGRSVNRA